MQQNGREFWQFRRSILVLLTLNILMSSLKLLLGYWIGSTALRSDGWNNAADFVYTLFFIGGMWISSQPPDETHPEGHARFESLVGLLVSFIIIGTGFYVLWDAYHAFKTPTEIPLSLPALVLVATSIVLKGLTGRFLLNEGTRLNSSALEAMGWDQTGDMLADGAVIAAVIGSYYQLPWLDPLVAASIGLSILWIGWEPLKRNFDDLTGRAPTDDLSAGVKPILEENEHFSEITSMRAHHVGPDLHVALTVKAPPTLTLNEVHDAEEHFREHILELEDVNRVFIHVEPPNANSPN